MINKLMAIAVAEHRPRVRLAGSAALTPRGAERGRVVFEKLIRSQDVRLP
jgi:hypothetical protein